MRSDDAHPTASSSQRRPLSRFAIAMVIASLDFLLLFIVMITVNCWKRKKQITKETASSALILVKTETHNTFLHSAPIRYAAFDRSDFDFLL